VSLADTLGLTTIAEGVETHLQRDCLLGLGCSRAQGYLFARPVPAAACDKVLDLSLEDRRTVGSQTVTALAGEVPVP
jgi:EAL domain-containing protein (putative c-di-GMP-specific phosphodiesterase class I)